jgi:hypothetical protein
MIEKAILRYKVALKYYHTLESGKESERQYYKLCGMEAILESLGVNVNEIIKTEI